MKEQLPKAQPQSYMMPQQAYYQQNESAAKMQQIPQLQYATPPMNQQYVSNQPDPMLFNAQLQNVSLTSPNKTIDDLERIYNQRQNETRSEDQDAEEKAMTNLAAQEYDALRVLQTIPEHTELYKFKLEQYKKLSEARARAELVLQEQRIKRVRKNFELQTKDYERKLQQEMWVEQQRRLLMKQKMGNSLDLTADKLLEEPVF